MPLYVIPFPAIDPVLISIGPVAVRWYALGYIVGILLGWLYARAVIRREALWGGPAPMTVADYDDFVLWVTLGIILGGRLGCVLAVIGFARYRGLSILSLGDITCAAATIGIFLVRIANFINGELWGRPTDVLWPLGF